MFWGEKRDTHTHKSWISLVSSLNLPRGKERTGRRATSKLVREKKNEVREDTREIEEKPIGAAGTKYRQQDELSLTIWCE